MLLNFASATVCLQENSLKLGCIRLQYEDYIDILHLKSCRSQVGTCEPSSFHSKPKLTHHIPPHTTAPKLLPATFQIDYLHFKLCIDFMESIQLIFHDPHLFSHYNSRSSLLFVFPPHFAFPS